MFRGFAREVPVGARRPLAKGTGGRGHGSARRFKGSEKKREAKAIEKVRTKEDAKEGKEA
jgi:hypothetical protein